MLSTAAIESAHVTASNLDQRGITVLPTPNTTLASLMAATCIPPRIEKNEDGYLLDAPYMSLLTDSPDDIVGCSEHSQVMAESADYIAEQLQRHIFKFRTEVVPAVEDLAKRLTAAYELVKGNPLNGMEIEIYNNAGVFSEPQLVESFARSREVQHRKLSLTMSLPEMGENEIRDLLRTGSPVVDESIMQFFSRQEEGWLVARWGTIFRPQEVVPSDGLDAYITGRSFDQVASALFVFLIARKLWNAPLPGTNMSAAAYEDLMIDYRDQAALRLCYEYDNMRRDSEEGILIRPTVTSFGGRSRIVVNEGAYKEFLKAGGTNELLLANTLRAIPYVLTRDLLENKETLLRTWQSHVTVKQTYYAAQAFNNFSESILCEYDHMVAETSQEDFPLQERGIAREYLIKARAAMKTDDVQDMHLLALRLLCASRFYKTDAERFLLTMRRVRLLNPAIPAQDAAEIATLEYVARWTASQMTLVAASSTATA